MAEGRMLKRKISVSEQVADLLNDTHRLLFTWGIAHLDVDGRMSANPRKFKALICPMLDHITVETIKSFFADVQQLGLIDVYEANGEWWMQYPTFGDHQKLRRDREADCVIPQSTEVKWTTPGVIRELSGSTPPKVKLSKVKTREGKLSQGTFENAPIIFPSTLNTPDFLKSWDEWKRHRKEKKKPLSSMGEQKSLDELVKFGPEWAIKRINQAIIAGWQGLIFKEDKPQDVKPVEIIPPHLKGLAL